MNYKQISSRLNKWLKENGFDTRTVVVDDDNAYYEHFEDRIVMCTREPNHSKIFFKYCQSLGLDKDPGWKIITFLHELGHGETSDELNSLQEWWSVIAKKVIETPSYTYTVMKIKANLYYRLPIEKFATQWAVDYILTHKKQIKQLKNIFEEAK